MSLSTAEAEYMALASAAQEAVWLQHFARDLNEISIEPTVIYEDTQLSVWRKIRSTMNALNMWILNFISSGYKRPQEQFSYNIVQAKIWLQMD